MHQIVKENISLWFYWGFMCFTAAISAPVRPPLEHGFVFDTAAEVNLLFTPHFCSVFHNSVLVPAARPGNESSLWGPQLRVHIQGFPLPFSGHLGASRSANADMLPITQPQLPESHPGWLFPRRRHGVCGLGLLSTTDWHHCSHLQHQHRWAVTQRQLTSKSGMLILVMVGQSLNGW